MSKGFTLLELMIVMVLIALASAVVVPRLSNNVSLTVRAETRQIMALLKNARRLAMIHGQEIEVPLVFQKTAVTGVQKTSTLIFFPTGGAQGQDIFHCRSPISVLIQLDTITGKVKPVFNYENNTCQADSINLLLGEYTYLNVIATKHQYLQKIQYLRQAATVEPEK